MTLSIMDQKVKDAIGSHPRILYIGRATELSDRTAVLAQGCDKMGERI
jgi:hypothetical protein